MNVTQPLPTNSTTASTMIWTEAELDEVLFQWDNDTAPIHEFRYSSSINIALHPVEAPTNSPYDPLQEKNSEGENKGGEGENNDKSVDSDFKPAYLNIPISGDDVHIVMLYAPWCPHCQDFKPIYVQLAREITKRSINVNVYFHAVSCTLNSDTCSTYDIEGYPTFFGYRGKVQGSEDDDAIAALIGNTTLRGTELELDHNLNGDIDTISSVMKFDVSSMERNFTNPESKYSNSADQRDYEQRKIQRAKEVAAEKIALLEYDASLNDIYHDAILSLAYILRNGVYYQSTSGNMLQNEAEKAALHDFLKLVHWSTPISWDVRKNFVATLVKEFDTVVIQGKGRLNDFIEGQTTTLQKHENLPWGFVDKNEAKHHQITRRRHGLGGDSPLHIHHHEKYQMNPKKWTKACNHGPSSSGFTCGLWELFHIVSIGSGLTKNQLYGFHQGYIINQHEIVETLRNFIANFFRCDVCRTNFINMYDSCGHDHCTRLNTDLPFTLKGGQHDVALWLWEVHNTVNVRLLREKAQRERRNFTKTEELAAKFPTRKSCPSCWLDNDMSQWDSVEVYRFLKQTYWPYDKSSAMDIKTMHGEMALEGKPLTKYGLICTLIPFMVLFGCMIVRKFTSKRNSMFLLQTLQKNKSF